MKAFFEKLIKKEPKKQGEGSESKKQQTPCGLTIDAGYDELFKHLQECQRPECKKTPLW